LWIDLMSAEDMAVEPAGLNAGELDGEGEIDIWFVPIRLTHSLPCNTLHDSAYFAGGGQRIAPKPIKNARDMSVAFFYHLRDAIYRSYT
jgi:hypothetical protein